MDHIPKISHYQHENLPKSGEGTEDPETQDLWLQAFQRSDVTAPSIQRREQQKDLETQTEFTTRDFGNKLVLAWQVE